MAPQVRPRAPGHVYVIKPRVLINGVEVVKIGMTTRTVEERVRSLKTGSVTGFDILYSLWVEDARALERDLHFRFRGSRLRGGGQEFFAVNPDAVIAEIERQATEVSRARAQKKRNQEMRAFKEETGLQAERASLNRFIGLCVLLVWMAIFVVAFVTGSVALAILNIFPASIIAIVIYTVIEARLFKRLIEPRYADAIRQKHVELRLKYPLAYEC